MSRIAIRVGNLGKRYHIGRVQARYRTLRESLASSLSRPFNLLRRPPSENNATVIWALKDISFDVQHGEVIGVIGRNGAGKSTLLKILSRITYPTTGFVDIYGRVGSLLEVGTGFHPELTGRENIYLNGAVLGMRKLEIDRRFDEIVSFAEIEQFLDTPVKRYSSGMYVRLAFSVAAHLEPEILLVDEVLAVGDMEFQKKCLGKMDSISRQERTVFFVSHNLPAIQRLCAKVLVLKKGQLAYFGQTQGGVAAYLADIAHRSVGGEIQPHMHRTYPPDFEVYQLELLDASRRPVSSLEINTPFIIRLACRIHQPRQSYRIGLIAPLYPDKHGPRITPSQRQVGRRVRH